MIFELCGEAEVEGHVSGQDGADDQLANLLQTTCTAIAVKCCKHFHSFIHLDVC